jgi:predicted kinase
MHIFKNFLKDNIELMHMMKSCSFHYDQDNVNKHHLEESVWAHTKLSYLNTVKFDTSIYIKWAIILHDIGRTLTREENTDKKSVYFGDYEGISVFMAIGILKKTKLSHSEKIRILKIVSYQYTAIEHVLHNDPTKEKILEIFKYEEELLKDLALYVRCDLLGRIVHKRRSSLYDKKKIDDFIAYTKDVHNNTHKVQNKKHTTYILVGPPCSRKTTWMKNKKSNAIVISRDIYTQEIGKKHNKNTFDAANDLIESNKQIKTQRSELELQNEKYAKKSKNKDIIIDNPNLSKKYRKEWITAKQNTHNIVVVLFLTPFESLIECDNKRSKELDKTITKELFIEKLESFEFPLLSEGIDEIEYIRSCRCKMTSHLN